ncbi:MAG TPA: hypothetical protein VL633_00300 [Bacteroidota bacterium]|nr:hypothetical protein [Bacteroidota bacterium]
MNHRTAIAVTAFIGLLHCTAYCQELPERVAPSKSDSIRSGNLASISLDKFLNTYLWNGNAIVNAAMDQYSLSLRESFTSTVIRTEQIRITDQQRLDVSLMRKLSDKLQVVGQATSFIVSDNRSIGISNVSSNGFYGGVEYRPISALAITPLIGVRLENQVDQPDRGVSYLLNLASDDLEYEGYHTQLAGRWQYDNLAPRTVENRNLSVTAVKYFFEETRNKLVVNYYRNRRDFYSPADSTVRQQFQVANNIEARSEDAFSVVDSLDYNVGEKLLLTFQGNVYNRDIDRETRYRTYSAGTQAPNTTIGELRIGGGMQLRYRDRKKADAVVEFTFQERDENHRLQPDDSLPNVTNLTRLEERKNNQSRRTSLASAIAYQVSRSNLISVSGSVNLLRYDTPSTENDDDRDELWYIVNLTTIHTINQYLTLRLSADANLTHLVYLASTRSADNTWNRILRLSPRVEYVPSGAFRTVNTFEVLANYTAYDFEYPSSPVRSYAFRQFGVIDSSGIDLTRKFGIEFFAQLRFYERGELRWDAFTERPLNYFEDRTYTGALRYRLNTSLLFSLGIRFFSQARFGYSGSERVLEQYTRSIGPVTSIGWVVATRSELSLHGWYEYQTQTGVSARGITNMTMLLTLHI